MTLIKDRVGLPSRINVEEVVANSFKDFHQKGFDYLCLRRTPTETLKLYFFDGDASKLPEVVAPHDHRYDFHTAVVAGASENVWFQRGYNRRGFDPKHFYGDDGRRYQRYEYRTPLNGGNGFVHVGEQVLVETYRRQFGPGAGYFMDAAGLHTIRIVANETVLFLRQFEDVVPVDRPTSTFMLTDSPPSLDGLYSRFTADQVLAKLRSFEERTGYKFETQE